MLSDPASDVTEALLSDLMISIIERFTPWQAMSTLLRDFGARHGQTDWRIRRAINVIRNDPKGTPNINALAKEAGLSRAHFYRLFERSTRMTPHLFVNLLRMELAVKTVVHSDDSLAVVSDSLGFAAPGHFTRFFRDHSGVTPSEFRQVARMGSAFPA